MKQPIRVVVAIDRSHFIEICKSLGLDPRRVKYVNFKDVDNGLAGYYRENIYPDEFASIRPSTPKTDNS